MTTIPLLCIIILMIVALNFIWECRKAREEADDNWMDAMLLYSDLFDLTIEHDKYKRPRDSKGRFIKGGS